MRIKNPVDCHFYCPDFFSHRLIVTTDSQLTDQELQCFQASLVLLQESLQKDAIDIDGAVSVIFINSDTLSIQSDDAPETLGWYNKIICLYVHRWRKLSLNDMQHMVVILEEFCHCYYRIWDELLVKQKVAQIMQLRFPQLSLYDCYPGLEECASPASR